MQLVDDKAIARGMIRVSPGEDLVEALAAVAEAAGWQEAFVTGAGVLELVELTRGSRTTTLENAEVISLSGRLFRDASGVHVALQAVLSVNGDLLTGRVEAAMTGALVMVVDAILGAVRAPDLARPRAPEPASNPTALDRASAPGSPSPAAAKSIGTPPLGAPSSLGSPPSQGLRPRPLTRPTSAPDLGDEQDEDNPMVDIGDVLHHPQLGRCEVVGHDASGGHQVRLSSGKVRVLRLDALRVLPGKDEDDGAMTFEIAGPRRRRGRF